MIAKNGSSSELLNVCINELTVHDARAGNLGELVVVKIEVNSTNKEDQKISPVEDEKNQRKDKNRVRYKMRRGKKLRTRKAKEKHFGNRGRCRIEEQQTKGAPFKEYRFNETIRKKREVKIMLGLTNQDKKRELRNMHSRENVTEEGDPGLSSVENDTKHGKQDKDSKGLLRTRNQELPRLIAQLQKQNFSALKTEIGQAKDILGKSPKKECIRVTEVESAQKLVLQLSYNLFCRMEKEIIALHWIPSLLPYKVMVGRVVQIKFFLKSPYNLGGLEEAVYDNILLTYKNILRIERRMRFLSDIAIGNAEKAIKKLVNQTFDSENYGVDKQMNTANLPINLKLGSSYLKKRIEIVRECVKRVVKVGYFLEHECNYNFLMRMYENPAELSAIFNQ